MATAILVDATIVRMVLVPAVMQILGRANWWIPGWLDRRLPRLDVEPREPAPTAR
jgi:RND superfamily putative drug exporter